MVFRYCFPKLHHSQVKDHSNCCFGIFYRKKGFEVVYGQHFCHLRLNVCVILNYIFVSVWNSRGKTLGDIFLKKITYFKNSTQYLFRATNLSSIWVYIFCTLENEPVVIFYFFIFFLFNNYEHQQ